MHVKWDADAASDQADKGLGLAAVDDVFPPILDCDRDGLVGRKVEHRSRASKIEGAAGSRGSTCGPGFERRDQSEESDRLDCFHGPFPHGRKATAKMYSDFEATAESV